MYTSESINVLSNYEQRPMLAWEENLYSQELAMGVKRMVKASTQIIRIHNTIRYVLEKKKCSEE